MLGEGRQKVSLSLLWAHTEKNLAQVPLEILGTPPPLQPLLLQATGGGSRPWTHNT